MDAEQKNLQELGSEPQHKDTARRKHRYSTLILLIAGVGLTAGVYAFKHAHLAKMIDKNDEITARVSDLEGKIKRQNDINDGVVAADDKYKDPKGKLGLLDGAITFTMPKGWSRATAEHCTGGFRDSKVLCYDIATIAPDNPPAALTGDDGVSHWSAKAAVYKYEGADGSAQNWHETKYDATPLVSYGIPAIRNINTDDINGDSSLSFEIVDDPAYVRVRHIVVHGRYAVLMEAQLQDGGIYGSYPGVKPYDFRDTYGPILRQFFESVKFQESQTNE